MASEELTPQAFILALIATLLVFYFLYLQLRRFRYRNIADQLRAAYESQGVFKTGEIAGSSHGRNYRITTGTVSSRSDSGTYTTVAVDCVNKGIDLSIYGRFFSHFPDWRFAFTTGDPLDSKYYARVQSLFHDIGVIFPNLVKKRRSRIDLKQEAISYRMRGVLTNAGTVKQILLLLTRLADRVESEPVETEPVQAGPTSSA
jgi:hypothetical protein